MNLPITHRELVLIGAKWLNKKAPNIHYKCQFVCAELVCQGLDEKPDIFGLSPHQNGTVKIEVKVSRADFMKDSEKISHQKVSLGAKKFYLAPKGLIKVDELPMYWGLLEFDGKNIEIVKHPTECAIDEKQLFFVYHSLLRRTQKPQIYNFRKDV